MSPKKYIGAMKSWDFGERLDVFNVVSEEVLWGNKNRGILERLDVFNVVSEEVHWGDEILGFWREVRRV